MRELIRRWRFFATAQAKWHPLQESCLHAFFFNKLNCLKRTQPTIDTCAFFSWSFSWLLRVACCKNKACKDERSKKSQVGALTLYYAEVWRRRRAGAASKSRRDAALHATLAALQQNKPRRNSLANNSNFTVTHLHSQLTIGRRAAALACAGGLLSLAR